MGVALALLAALAFGVSDFAAGVASRRVSAGQVTAVAQALGVLTAIVGVIVFSGSGPAAPALGWGALSGVGSAVGTLSLYRGLATGRMTIVATLSAVLTAVIPALVGIALGNDISALALTGIVLSLPAIALVSWQPDTMTAGHAGGTRYGLLSGIGFALLFIALDRAGTHSGAWPLLPGQLVSLLLILPFARATSDHQQPKAPSTIALILAAGIVSGSANLLFLAATGHGQLAIISVLGAMYPAVTVLLARVVLDETITRRQAAGLLAASAAIILVTLG